MKHREKSIELLNNAVALEIETVLQYLYFHFHFEDKGYSYLANLFKSISIKEMGHIDRLADRIMFLKGEVIMKPSKGIVYLEKSKTGDINVDVKKVLGIAAELESITVDLYNKWACECSAEGDSASKRLFEELVANEEEHEDIFDTEGDNFHKFGDTYLALQSVQRVKAYPKEEESTGSEE